MKHLKLIGLAAVAAMAVIGFGGAGTASATVLCKATESPCSESNLIKNSSLIHADLEGRSVSEFTFSYIFESCTGGTLTAGLSSQGGAASTVIVGTAPSSWTWSGCEAGGVTATESGEIEIHHNAGTDNGTLTAKGFGFKFATLNSECIYVPSSLSELGVLTGGVFPTIEINTVLVKSKGSLSCYQDFFWRATYKITSPAPLYVGAS
jgi:hypothetical protein